MIDIMKNWIATMLCIGIFLTFVQMIVPNTKLKKYIYSLIGIVTFVTLIMPTANYLQVEKLEEVTQSVLNDMEKESGNIITIDNNNTKDKLKENLKAEFTQKIKKDLKQKLSDSGVNTEMISIISDDEYNIQKINVKIKSEAKLNFNINAIFKCIRENYNVSDEKVVIEEV